MKCQRNLLAVLFKSLNIIFRLIFSCNCMHTKSTHADVLSCNLFFYKDSRIAIFVLRLTVLVLMFNPFGVDVLCCHGFPTDYIGGY